MLINRTNFISYNNNISWVSISCVLSHRAGKHISSAEMEDIQSHNLTIKLATPIMDTFQTGGLHRAIMDCRGDLC